MVAYLFTRNVDGLPKRNTQLRKSEFTERVSPPRLTRGS